MFRPREKKKEENPWLKGLIAAAGMEVEVWPENWPAFQLFHSIHTQWRYAGGGLDYAVLFKKLDRMNLTPDQYDQFEDDIRAMEYAALAAMAPNDD